MTDTALGANDPHKADVAARMAKPYKLDPGGTLVAPASVYPPFDYISAASGLISTVIDLARYDAAIDRDLVYSAQAKQQIWTVGTSQTGRRFPYGLGWFVRSFPPRGQGCSGTMVGTRTRSRRSCSRCRNGN
jgi:CubicO group peptidase (beta-lactamase class C family)